MAGCEAAWQAAQCGLSVDLYEMRPTKMTEAHQTGDLAEIICSNSLGSSQPDRPAGLLQTELETCNSLLLNCAKMSALPAGNALAVDRKKFSELVSSSIQSQKNIRIVREEVQTIPDVLTIIASGPLTSPKFSNAIAKFLGEENLFFFDALSPIVSADSINFDIAFRASRFKLEEQTEGDYINCPMNETQYRHFVKELVGAKQIQLKKFESEIHDGINKGIKSYFEGCLPVEEIARRGENSLAFGPLRPIGLRDPRTDQRPCAVVQLRQDDLAGELYNLVGFQTNLTFSEQKRVFQLIPGLENAEFTRYGQMHRNTFICTPKLLKPTLQINQREDLFFAGQIAGVEGYLGNIAAGLVAGINAARKFFKKELLIFPETTMIGALCHYITHAEANHFQPMKANFGILPPPENPIRSKHDRNQHFVKRATSDLSRFLTEKPLYD